MTFSARVDQASQYGARLASTGLQATMSPNTSALVFNAVAGTTDPSPQVISVSNTGAGQFAGIGRGNITYLQGSGWLNATITQGYPALVTVQPSLGSLTQGTYNATFQITDANASNSPITISVQFVVASAAQSPIIAVSATSLTFTGTAGGADTADQSITITNAGGGSFAGLALANLVYGSGSGWLAPPSGQPYLVGNTVSAHAVPSAVAAGNYSATFQVTDANATNSPVTVTVNLAASAAANPILNFSSQTANFTAVQGGGNPVTQSINITNSGSGSLAGPATTAVTYLQGTGWLTTKTVTTVTAGSAYTLTVGLTTGALTAGTYNAYFDVTDANATNSPQRFTVSFAITSVTPPGNKPPPRFTLPQGSTQNATFDTQTGLVSYNAFTYNGLTDPDGDPASASYYYGPTGTGPNGAGGGGTAQIRNVTSEATFQSALNAAIDGDILEFQNAFTVTGQITLPVRASGWVLMRPKTASTTPKTGTLVNRRARASHFASVEKVTLANSGYTIKCSNVGASTGYHFRECYFENGYGATLGANSTGLIAWDGLQANGNSQDTLANAPSRMKIERCYFNNPYVQAGTKYCTRAIMMSGRYARILDNCMLGFLKYQGGDSQALGGCSGLGDYEIWNNTLEGGSENILFGGSPVNLPNGGSRDYFKNVCIHHNDFTKRTGWLTDNDANFSQKNFVEVKMGQNWFIGYNYCANHYSYGQSEAFVIKQSPQNNAECAWLKTNNITVWHNLVENASGLAEISCGDSNGLNQQSATPTNRVELRGNAVISTFITDYFRLHTIVGGFANGSHSMADIVLDHNWTADKAGIVLVGPDYTTTLGIIFTNLVATNNIAWQNAIPYGEAVNASNGIINLDALQKYCGPTSFTFAKNAAVSSNGSTAYYNSAPGNLTSAPYSNRYFASTASLNTQLNTSTYQRNVLSTSTGSNGLYQAGTDGLDIGPDWDLLQLALAAKAI